MADQEIGWDWSLGKISGDSVFSQYKDKLWGFGSVFVVNPSNST